MADNDIALMAHLMRRAGFGATYEELQARAAKGYEATVEELLHPEEQIEIPLDLVHRYFPILKELPTQSYWLYRMVNTLRPLEERISLFWHGIFCVGHSKCNNTMMEVLQYNKFRRRGLGRFPDLLVQLATDPAMLFYLDNQMSHKDAVNENWGRELLELFTMGVGMDGAPNYTEDDVKACARAFTGWTVGNGMPRYPYNRYKNSFFYNPDDHDGGVKTFLGETGRFNGEDIIDIIVKQPATARFLSRHLYNFFVADEPPVPAWQNTPPQNPEAIKMLEEEYFRSDFDIRSMLRVLFNSDFFKNARFARVKSPVDVVAGTLRLVGGYEQLKPALKLVAEEMTYMGQDLDDPPTVEGWHSGQEWIDSGTLVERINFVAGQVGEINQPGIRAIINQLGSGGSTISPESLLDGCLEMLGAYELSEETHSQLAALAREEGTLQTGTEEFAQQVGLMLQLIVSTQEYQFA